jgi:hypothetical protein
LEEVLSTLDSLEFEKMCFSLGISISRDLKVEGDGDRVVALLNYCYKNTPSKLERLWKYLLFAKQYDITDMAS